MICFFKFHPTNNLYLELPSMLPLIAWVLSRASFNNITSSFLSSSDFLTFIYLINLLDIFIFSLFLSSHQIISFIIFILLFFSLKVSSSIEWQNIFFAFCIPNHHSFHTFPSIILLVVYPNWILHYPLFSIWKQCIFLTCFCDAEHLCVLQLKLNLRRICHKLSTLLFVMNDFHRC